ncbi:MAG: hypothetical protein M0R03_13725 [Novosphingobium sp.]|nr:hypothetical protein [Novosphingobium sp.]
MVFFALFLAACVTPSVPSAFAGLERLQALGTEPFWSVHADGATLRYTTPEDMEGTPFAAERREADGALVFTGILNGEAFSLRVTLGACSDGMSDTVYSYRAEVAHGSRELTGCARKPLN